MNKNVGFHIPCFFSKYFLLIPCTSNPPIVYKMSVFCLINDITSPSYMVYITIVTNSVVAFSSFDNTNIPMVANCSNIDLKLFTCPIIESFVGIFMLYEFFFNT